MVCRSCCVTPAGSHGRRSWGEGTQQCPRRPLTRGPRERTTRSLDPFDGRRAMTQPLEHLTFEKPDEVREGDNWRLELLNLAGGAQVGRITVQPGWRWTE